MNAVKLRVVNRTEVSRLLLLRAVTETAIAALVVEAVVVTTIPKIY